MDDSFGFGFVAGILVTLFVLGVCVGNAADPYEKVREFIKWCETSEQTLSQGFNEAKTQYIFECK